MGQMAFISEQVEWHGTSKRIISGFHFGYGTGIAVLFDKSEGDAKYKETVRQYLLLLIILSYRVLLPAASRRLKFKVQAKRASWKEG